MKYLVSYNESLFNDYLTKAKLGLLTSSTFLILNSSPAFSQSQINYLKKVNIHHIAKKGSNTYHNGIDISKYQSVEDWKCLNNTQDFIICKSTEGVSIVDPKFQEHWKNIKTTKGAYHFFIPYCSGIEQAKHYLSVVHLKSGMIKPIIDVEHMSCWNNKKNRKKYVDNLVEMMIYLKSKTGNTPIIYTTSSFWIKNIQPYIGKRCPYYLWIARYGKKPEDSKPWTMWQYTDSGKTKGVEGCVDKDVCKDINKLIIK